LEVHKLQQPNQNSPYHHKTSNLPIFPARLSIHLTDKHTLPVELSIRLPEKDIRRGELTIRLPEKDIRRVDMSIRHPEEDTRRVDACIRPPVILIQLTNFEGHADSMALVAGFRAVKALFDNFL
jgi:hypothetical protein